MPHAKDRNLDKLFAPDSVAVVGASRDSKKIGNITLRNIIESGYKGKIYPINPKATQIHNQKVYPSIASLPETPDLAIISLPVGLVIESLKQGIEKEIKNYVIYTAGFKETGTEGEVLEKEIKSLAFNYKLNILGPNCLGFANNDHKINATFGKPANTSGKLKFLSQSGAIAAALFDWAEYTNLGFSEFVTLGNKADLGENDILDYWKETATKEYTPIGMYLESISDGKRFIKLASEITKVSPIFVLKPGKSEAAKHAMQSHTGALAGEDAVLEVALKRAGVIRCDGIQDMFDLVRAFSWGESPRNSNIAIVSNAGGPAVISADAVSKHELNLVPISSGNKKYLSEHLPRSASLLNPVDVLGDALADRYKVATETVLKQEDVNSVLVLLTPQVMTEIKETANVIATLRDKYKKPIFCSFIGGNQVSRGQQILNRSKIPSFAYPERAIKAIAQMWQWVLLKQNPQQDALQVKIHEDVVHLVRFAKENNRKALSGLEVDFILQKLGLDTPATEEATTTDKAKRFALTHGWPVVLKLSSDNLLHKTEAGALITNISTEDALNTAFNNLDKKRNQLTPNIRERTSIQIQKQIEGGLEIIIGVKQDPTFGYVMMFGAGGIYAEILKDTNLAMLPLSRKQITDLVSSSKVYEILKGARGQPPYYLKGLYDVMEKVTQLALALPEFKSFEINPVIVNHGRVWLVDGKATL